MNNKLLLYSTGNYIQYPGWGWGGRKQNGDSSSHSSGLNITTETVRLKIQQSGAVENNSP